MTNKEMLPILIALRSKPAQTSLTDEEFSQVYQYVLKQTPPEHAETLVRWIMLECKRWRPTTDQIHAYSQRLAGTVTPDGGAVIREIRQAITRFGKFHMPVPGRPNLKLLGTPRMSYEALRFVEEHGGWCELLESEVGNREIFWHEAEKRASTLCETIRIEQTSRRLNPAQSLGIDAIRNSIGEMPATPGATQ